MCFLTALLLVSGVQVIQGVYNDSLARNILWPMASAAYSTKPQLCVTDKFSNAKFIGQYTVVCDQDKKDTCSVFVAVAPSERAIIVSFRGSNSHHEVTQEENVTLTQWPVPFVGGGKVNPFFAHGYQLLQAGGFKDGFLATKNKYPDYRILITGHSLGAALASMAAGTFVYMGYMQSSQVTLVTFGQPRVGDLQYANAIDTLVPQAYRVVHAMDIVPHMPPAYILGYVHHKSEIWYNNDMSSPTFIECDENETKKCSNSGSNFNWDDHHMYFGLDAGFAKQGCPTAATNNA